MLHNVSYFRKIGRFFTFGVTTVYCVFLNIGLLWFHHLNIKGKGILCAGGQKVGVKTKETCPPWLLISQNPSEKMDAITRCAYWRLWFPWSSWKSTIKKRDGSSTTDNKRKPTKWNNALRTVLRANSAEVNKAEVENLILLGHANSGEYIVFFRTYMYSRTPI